MVFGVMLISGAVQTRQYAGRGAPFASKRAQLLAACSFPRRSAEVGAPFAAAERIFASPWSPTHIVRCADRSDYTTGDFQTGWSVPSARHIAQSASLAFALA